MIELLLGLPRSYASKFKPARKMSAAEKRCSSCGESSAAKKTAAGVVNVPQWLEDNKDRFHPPVCNKVLYVVFSVF